jgi:GNAT superfamily N-acetyltransferase
MDKTGVVGTEPELRFSKYFGAAFAAQFDALAALRIAVFREFPYLYEGSLDYEKTYLQTYADSDRSLLFAIWEGEQMIGATTCIPLQDETEDVQAPFKKAGIDTAPIFYFGESLLLPAFRGRGLGHRFFEEREHHAAHFGTYTHCCFCAVQRPADHILRPMGYQPLDAFWKKRGYLKCPELHTTFAWRDLGEDHSTAKPMNFWMKALPKP